MSEVRSRKEQLEAELKAIESLGRIEERREKSLATNVNRVNEKYDLLRDAALAEIDPKVREELNKTDPAQQAFLGRVQARADANAAALVAAEADAEQVAEEDIEEVE